MDWRRDTSQIYKTLKWLILPMTCIGWYTDRFTQKRTRFLQMLTTIVIMITFISNIAFITNNLMVFGVSTLYVSGFVQNVVAIFTFIFGRVYISRRFNQFVISCDQLKNKDTLFRYIGSPITGIVISGIICFSFFLSKAILTFYETLSITHDVTAWLFLFLLGYFLCCLFYYFQIFLVMSLTHCLCWLLRAEFTQRCKKLNELADTGTLGSNLEEVRKRYVDVSDLTGVADNMLSPISSTVLLSSAFFNCFVFNNVVKNWQHTAALISPLLFLISGIYDIIFILSQGCLLHEAVNACATVPTRFNISNMTPKTGIQTMLLMETMKNKEVGLSFMKMFILNKHSVLTVVGTLMTYMIVVLQFRPE